MVFQVQPSSSLLVSSRADAVGVSTPVVGLTPTGTAAKARFELSRSVFDEDEDCILTGTVNAEEEEKTELHGDFREL